MPERKTMLVWVKEYIIKNFATCKSLCNLQELYTAFKEKHPNVNIGFSKFCALRPKWCVLAGSKMAQSVYVCSAHQNIVLLVDAMDWGLTYKDLTYCKLLPLLVYYFGPDGILQHDLLCFSSDDNNHYTSFFHQVQTMLVYYLKANHSNIIKN